MSMSQPSTAPPVGHVRVIYLGPVAPHWEVHSDFGDPRLIDAFRSLRVKATGLDASVAKLSRDPEPVLSVRIRLVDP